MGREGRGEVLVPPSSGSWGGRASYQLWWGGGWRGATIWVTRARRQRPLRWSLKHTMRCVSTNRSRLPRWDEMLRVVAPYVAEMLHLKSLSINRVAGVAGFQTMSTCKPHLKSLTINVVVGVFTGFLSVASWHTPFPGRGWRREGGGWSRNEWCQLQFVQFVEIRVIRVKAFWPFSTCRAIAKRRRTKVAVGRSR
jgi:hypothetical protein